MGFIINDKTLISEITEKLCCIGDKEKEQYKDTTFEHPLDTDIKSILIRLKPSSGESIEYTQTAQLDELWETLINKSIICLRFFDKREPFYNDPNKIAIAYGLDKLKQYHERYTNFESLLYGSSSVYRDHVFHSVRTWMLGTFCLLKTIRDGRFIDSIGIDGVEDRQFTKKINFFEKISMWTIIALCHDLGYPLEKSQQILDRTREMMKDFIQNPNIWNNFGFSGIQDNINEYIVKFMSTKMKGSHVNEEEGYENNKFIGRIQPKYYLKYTKSLERFDHGIISAVIIYKMLLYFLESDFNLNDDYIYTYEDARQFYIRREILRSMSSHTCSDIYNIHLTTFSSLLFFCDELQEWGRKSWNELYAGLLPNAIELTIDTFVPTEIKVHERIDMSSINEQQIIIDNISRIFERQYVYYKLIFRDGQYTVNREFSFVKNITLALKTYGTQANEIHIEYSMTSDNKNYFKIDVTEAPDFKTDFENNMDNKLKKALYYSELNITE
ncbi:MAG: hypothetical protein ABFC94_14305 [Syntrophomonas sp.]